MKTITAKIITNLFIIIHHYNTHSGKKLPSNAMLCEPTWSDTRCTARWPWRTCRHLYSTNVSENCSVARMSWVLEGPVWSCSGLQTASGCRCPIGCFEHTTPPKRERTIIRPIIKHTVALTNTPSCTFPFYRYRQPEGSKHQHQLCTALLLVSRYTHPPTISK